MCGIASCKDSTEKKASIECENHDKGFVLFLNEVYNVMYGESLTQGDQSMAWFLYENGKE